MGEKLNTNMDIDAQILESAIEQARPEIIYPILDINDLGPGIKDLRYDKRLPSDVAEQLGEDEIVVHIHEPDVVYPTKTPSAIEAIKRLTLSPTWHQVGEVGPSLASISSEENRHIAALSKFEELHSRDGLHTALHIYKQRPELLGATLKPLAKLIGLDDEDYIDGVPFRHEEEGRIMLLNRGPNDPVGHRFSEKLSWGWPFYGSIDATPLFISSITQHLNEHDPNFLHTKVINRKNQEWTMKDAFDLAVKWLIKKTDENSEHLLEFKNKAKKGGMLNQAWKDSASAYIHSDGEWANHNAGIASVEVQGLAYDAYIDAARLYRSLGNDKLAEQLEERAAEIKWMVLNKFWAEDSRGGYFTLGTDRDDSGNLRQMNVRTSNMGQLLKTKLLSGDERDVEEKRQQTILTLLSSEMLSPHGLRTLSNREVAFRKRGYHTGSFWIWDNDAAGDGVANYGYYGAARYFWGLSLKDVYDTKMFFELGQGGDEPELELNRQEIYVYNKKHDILYLYEQLPQQFQGWSVSSTLATKYKYFLIPEHAQDPEKLKLERHALKDLPKLDF
jgi:glycogen debranching enzyme